MDNKSILIRKMAYELYKLDWLKRITRDMEMIVVRNYYEEIKDNNENYSMEDYISDVGYGNCGIYACYNEFINNEYLDKDYIRQILDDNKMFEDYKTDIMENFK